MALLAVENLDITPFKGMNKTFRNGTISFIAGANNSYKTLLIKVLSGIVKTEEKIRINRTFIEQITTKQYPYQIQTIFEDDKFKNQTVILAGSAIEKDFREYLYLLRNKNIRVILLLNNEKDENTKIALENGIYDLIFGNFYPSQIKDILDNPKTFADISKIYRKLFNIQIKKKIRKDFNNGKK